MHVNEIALRTSFLFFVVILSSTARPTDHYQESGLEIHVESLPRWVNEPGGFRQRGSNDSVILDTKLRKKTRINRRQTLHVEPQDQISPSMMGSQSDVLEYKGLETRNDPSGFISSLLFTAAPTFSFFASTASATASPQETSRSEAGGGDMTQIQASTISQLATPSSALSSTISMPSPSSYSYNLNLKTEDTTTAMKPSSGESAADTEYKQPAWNIIQCLVYNWSPDWPGLADDAKQAYSRCVDRGVKKTFHSSSTPFPTPFASATPLMTFTSAGSTPSTTLDEAAMPMTAQSTATSVLPSPTLIEPSAVVSISDSIATSAHSRVLRDGAGVTGTPSVAEI